MSIFSICFNLFNLIVSILLEDCSSFYYMKLNNSNKVVYGLSCTQAQSSDVCFKNKFSLGEPHLSRSVLKQFSNLPQCINLNLSSKYLILLKTEPHLIHLFICLRRLY